MVILILILLIILSILYFYGKAQGFTDGTINITSESFQDGDTFHKDQICYDKGGTNHTPNLTWEHPQDDNVKSYAILLQDMDATHSIDDNWVHWIVSYISITRDNDNKVTHHVEFPSMVLEGTKTLTIGHEQRKIIQGKNSWGILGYRGPCPPPGSAHNYTLTVYALDIAIEEEELTLNPFLQKIKNHILYQGSIYGLYQTTK